MDYRKNIEVNKRTEKRSLMKSRQIALLLFVLCGTTLARAQFVSPNVAPILSSRPGPKDTVIVPAQKINDVVLDEGLSGGGVSNNSSRVTGNHFPYPIIFVHGLGGDEGTFSTFSDWFSGLAGDPSIVGYCLNSNGSFANATNDVTGPFGAINCSDTYILTFKCTAAGNCIDTDDYLSIESSASAIFKQAQAISEFIEQVLVVTGREKVVLVGHSMGGLAIREYSQNSGHWFDSAHHHVAKIVSIGTPHWGSNFEFAELIDPLLQDLIDTPPPTSEAVRDLKNGYDETLFWNNPGVFLWGGQESQSWMDDGILNWDNVDVNCNGIIGQSINGLNFRSFDLDIEYACMWELDDDVVSPDNVHYYLGNNAWFEDALDEGGENLCTVISAFYNDDSSECESWGYDLPSDLEAGYWEIDSHTALAAYNTGVVRTLDEPDCYEEAYEVEEGILYYGMVTEQANDAEWTNTDYDVFKITMPENGEITIIAQSWEGLSTPLNCRVLTAPTDGSCSINDVYGSISIPTGGADFLITEVPEGDIFVEFWGANLAAGYVQGSYGFEISIGITGCTMTAACNYNPQANINDGSCFNVGDSCNDGNLQTINDAYNSDCICQGTMIVQGCMDSSACNFSEQATVSDDSCYYTGDPCNDGNSQTINDTYNFNCDCQGTTIVEGCMDSSACNFSELATVSDNSCFYTGDPCNDGNPQTMNDTYNANCICQGIISIYGCMDASACNFEPEANQNGGCVFPGDACSDGNDNTENDLLDENCDCIGTNISSAIDIDLSDVLIYPNPVSEYVTIQFLHSRLVTFQLLDARGRILDDWSASQTSRRDVSDLSIGYYVIVLGDEMGGKTIRHLQIKR